MPDIYFILALLFILGFWIFDAYKILKFYSTIEEAKNWQPREAKLVGIETANLAKKPSKNFIARLYRFLFSPERFNYFAYFSEGDVKVGAFTFSLYPKHTRHISFFSRSILRSDPEFVEVYVNPSKPHENVLIPPSEHKIIGKVVWFGIKTFTLTFALLYLFY